MIINKGWDYKMNTVSVNVYQNNSLIAQANNRPRRNTPKGITGVVYRGLVYPVFNDGDHGLHINVDGDSYDREECPTCPTEQKSNWGQTTIGIENTAHYVETNQFGHYFVFNGSHELYESVDLFSQNGSHLLPFISSGESFRPADNGIQYDWYIRFDSECRPEKILKHILPALNNFLAGVETPIEANSISTETESTGLDLYRLAKDLEKINAKLERLNDEIDQKDQQLNNERNKRSQLNAEITRLQLALETYENGQQNQSDGIREYEKYLDEIARENHKLKEDKDKVDELNTLLVAQKTKLEAQLENTHSINGSRILKKKTYDFCVAYLGLLDRVSFDTTSIDIMLTKFCDYSHLFQILQDINDGNEIRAFPIHGRGNRDPLYEVNAHIRTGTAGIRTMGRLYYKRIAGEDRIEAFLHVKKNDADQRRFINSIP